MGLVHGLRMVDLAFFCMLCFLYFAFVVEGVVEGEWGGMGVSLCCCFRSVHNSVCVYSVSI